MAEVWRYFAHEDDYPDLDERACCERLSRAVRFETVSHMDPSETDWAEFDALEAYLEGAFPATFAAARVERVGHSLLLTIAGADRDLRPAQLMGHMDVVPVVEGTEGDWGHGPFSGDVDGTYVWGRGTVDMKDMVTGELEAVEYVLSHGLELRRTLILAFGQDEEDLQSGARAMGELLESRGVELEFLVDEGDYRIVDGVEYGAPGTPVMHVDLAEKGYADVRLSTRSEGGHSSNPFGGTSLGVLAEAIARIAGSPWPARLTGLDRGTLAALAPHITTGPLAPLVSGASGPGGWDAAGIAAACLGDPHLFPLVTTTVAPTMIEGGSQAGNVMPQDMWANVNFRMLEGTTQADVVAACERLVADLPVTVGLAGGGNDPSATSRADGYGFAKLSEVAGRYFRDPATAEPVTLVPALATGATDARMYERVCDSCLRFSAFVVDDGEAERGVHGTDERVTRRAYLQGIRFLIRLVEETCVRV